jgi:hypothetical protein
LTWEDAQESCRHDGGNLISITSLEKWNFVTNYITACWSSEKRAYSSSHKNVTYSRQYIPEKNFPFGIKQYSFICTIGTTVFSKVYSSGIL